MIKEYFKNAGILSFTEILLALRGFILIPILTKAYGAVNYGIWAQVAIIVGMISPLIIMGTYEAMIRFIPGESKEYARKCISTELLYILLLSLLVALILCVSSTSLSTSFFGGLENSRFVALCGYVIIVNLIFSICRQWYRIQNKAKIYSAINIALSFFTAFLAAGVAIFKGDIFELIVLTTSAEAVIAAVLLVHIAIKWGFERPDITILRRFLKYGLPVMPAGYAMWVLNASDRLFLGYYGTMADIGVYSVVYGFGYMLINLFFNPIWLMYAPKATKLYNQGNLIELNRLFKYSTKAALCLLIPAMVGFSILAIPVLSILTTPEFLRGAQLAPLVTLGYVFHMMSSYFAVSLGLMHKQIWSTISTFIAAASNIALNFLLIPIIGITGAAIATCISFGVQMVITMIIGSRYIQLDFDWRFFGKVAFSSFVMGAVISLIEPAGMVYLLLVVLTGSLIYLVMMIITRAADSDEIEAVISYLRLDWLMKYPLVCSFLGIRR